MSTLTHTRRVTRRPRPAGAGSRLPPPAGRRGAVSSWVPVGRALHLIDVENLLGSPRARTAEIRALLDRYERTAGVRPRDQVEVACNPFLAARDESLWEGVLLRVGHGADGADKALLRNKCAGSLARCYPRVVVGSGDHAFAPLVRSLVRLGTRVRIVSRYGSLSKRLFEAAERVVTYLPRRRRRRRGSARPGFPGRPGPLRPPEGAW